MIDDTRNAAPEHTPVRDTGVRYSRRGVLLPPLVRPPAAPYRYYWVHSALEARGLSLWHGSRRLIGSRS